jgi:hypothetical protein
MVGSRPAVLAILLVAFSLVSSSASMATTARPVGQPSSSVAAGSFARLVHRVVWDDFAANGRGIHLDSANRASGGSSHVVMSHVWSVRMSGDGKHILTTRAEDGMRSVWYSATDGTTRVRLYGMNRARNVSYWEPSLDFTGTRVLALRVTRRELGRPDVYDVVTWDVAVGPEAATSLTWLEGNPFPDWN